MRKTPSPAIVFGMMEVLYEFGVNKTYGEVEKKLTEIIERGKVVFEEITLDNSGN
jgi:hypothetical protein